METQTVVPCYDSRQKRWCEKQRKRAQPCSAAQSLCWPFTGGNFSLIFTYSRGRM